MGDMKFSTEQEQEQELLEPYARFRGEPLSALQELSAHIWGEGWRSYKNIVGQPIFYKGFSEHIKSLVMRQETLNKQISLLANKRVEVELQQGLLGALGVEGEHVEAKSKRESRRREIEDQLRQLCDQWLDKMICKMERNGFIRSAYYLASQLLTRAYHQGVHSSPEEVARLRAVAEEAAKKKQSIIFLPCHRSHVDYVSLQVICFRLGIALPIVVAGDNLNFFGVGWFLQHAGAMWIRRSFGEDELYPTLLQAYMDTLLQNGHNVECFVEGGRSRTGKLLQPKFGILRFFLESVLSGRVEDAMVCPVSTQYDKVIEVDSYTRELLGQPKRKEDLATFISASNVLSYKLGRVDVRFHQPWSLREFIDEQQTKIVRQPAGINAASGDALRRRLLQTLGYRVLSDINKASVVMPTALVGTVLLTLRGRGVGKSELVRRVDWLCDRVISQGGKIAHFAGNPTEVVVEHALEVLGPGLVGKIDGLAEETYLAEDRFQLSFYRNMTIHLFVSQAMICAAMYTKIKQGGGAEIQRITYSELRDYVHFLSQLFRAEFIFPTTSLEENIDDGLQKLELDRVVKVHRNINDRQKPDCIELHPEERASGRENYDFYCFLIWPFVEAAWLGTISLFMLTPHPDHKDDFEAWLDLNAFQHKAQQLGKTLYHQGDLSYFEAVNKEALKNAFSHTEEASIVYVTRSRESKIPPRVKLDLEWMPGRDGEGKLKAEGRLWDLSERISQSRREGKNRRDGATVRTRVLGLADRVGADLFDTAVMEADGQRHRMQRRKAIQVKSQL